MDRHIEVSGGSAGAAGFSHPLQAQLFPFPDVRGDVDEEFPARLAGRIADLPAKTGLAGGKNDGIL